MAFLTTLQSSVIQYEHNGTYNVSLPDIINNSTSVIAENDNQHSGLEQFASEFLVPSGVISVIVAAFGIVFNILNIIVLSHPKMRNSVNLLLTLMAVCELLLLVIYIPYVSIFNLGAPTETIPRFHTQNINSARFMLFYADASVILHMSASWLIIATACFRFIYVQFPLRSAQMCSYRRAVLAGACTIGACVLVSVPNILLNTIDSYRYDEHTNTTISAQHPVYYFLSGNPDYSVGFRIFNFWRYAIVGKFIPTILLLVFTIFLIVVLLEANKRKQRLHSDAGIKRPKQTPGACNEHSQTARMLLAVVALFFVIEFPHGLLIVYVVVTNDDQTYVHLGEVIDLVTVIAFSLNLILYSAMSRQYRKLFVTLFIKDIRDKLRHFTQIKAKYQKCSCSGVSHTAVCTGPTMTETCALSIKHDPHTLHSVVHSEGSEDQNLVSGERKSYNNT